MKRIFRLGISALALALTIYFLWSAIDKIDARAIAKLAEPTTVAAIATAALFVALITPLSACVWKRLLLAQGESRSTLLLASIQGVTQIAKYIPGNIAQHVGRLALSLRAGISARATIVSSTQEMAIVACASIFVGAAMLAVSGTSMAYLNERTRLILATAGITATAAMLVLSSLKSFQHWCASHPWHWLRAFGRLGIFPGPGSVLLGLVLYSAYYLLIGAGLWIVARAIDLPPAVSYTAITAAFAMSWLLGFIAPGMPAGLGVRESIMLLVLKDSAPQDALLLFVALARIVTVLGDVVCFISASIVIRTRHVSSEIFHEHRTRANR